MTLVVDASFLLACVLEDEQSDTAVAAIAAALGSGLALAAPFHFPVELLSGLEQAARRGRLDSASRYQTYRTAVEHGIELVTLPIDGGPGVPALFDLVDRTALRVHDALYLQLALARRAPLATLDRALRASALGEGIVVIPDDGKRAPAPRGRRRRTPGS